MASTLKISVAQKNALLNSFSTLLGAGATINIYDGAQPASPDVAVSTQNLLATLTGAGTFAPAASGGILTANALTSGTGTVAAGTGKTATWFRASSSSAAASFDGSVANAGADMNINNTSIATGQTVAASSLTITAPN